MPLQFESAPFRFAELENWRLAVLPILRDPAVSWSEIDEVRNDILIGLDESTAQARIEQDLQLRGVPRDAIRFQASSKPARFAVLSDRIRPFRAGIRVSSFFNQQPFGDVRVLCTYGANVVWVGHPGPYMVTNSHCTQLTPPFGQYVGAAFYQNIAPQYQSDSSTYVIGGETVDPNGFTGYPCPPSAICRYSDAALIHGTGDTQDDVFDQGYVSRPIGPPVSPPVLSGTLNIDSNNPTIRIDGVLSSVLVGDVLSKVGATTGWTSGVVGSTCRDLYDQDIYNLNQDYYLLCQGVDSLGGGHGDSGSPMLFQTTDGRFLIAGLLWGGEPPLGGATYSSVAYFSTWGEISSEVAGSQTALNPAASDVTASITGPTYVTIPGTLYGWTAHASGRNGTYSYYWEQEFGSVWSHLGTDSPLFAEKLFGNGTNIFYLRVTVTSNGSAKTSAPFRVVEDFTSGGCVPQPGHPCPQ